jgi:glycosyltransferase involved in cell wall biosynthesis
MPVNWPEPFGLVSIEALACGTPVIAYNRGAVPEVLKDGLTGFVVPNLQAATEAVLRLPQVSRRSCRRHFENRFTASRMSKDYEILYNKLMNLNAEPPVLTASEG